MDGINTFPEPRLLPVYRDDQRQPDEPCDGYRFLGHEYDGFRNKVHIQPVRLKVEDVPGIGRYCTGCEDVGQDYTIRVGGTYGIH